MTEERFVPVQGFEGRFWISDFGRIISYDKRRSIVNFMRFHIDVCGYYQTQLRMKPLSRKVRVHTLVGEHYVERNDSSHLLINHLTGVKLWNYYKDLEWGDHASNSKHAVKTGLFNIKGEKHPMSKLTEDNVRELRRLRQEGWTYGKLGKLFSIERRQASDVARGVNWGWLKD